MAKGKADVPSANRAGGMRLADALITGNPLVGAIYRANVASVSDNVLPASRWQKKASAATEISLTRRAVIQERGEVSAGGPPAALCWRKFFADEFWLKAT